MTNCELCKKSLELGEISKYDIGQHAVCHDMWAERRDSGTCTRCGEKPERHDNALHCADCLGDWDWKNYPGPDP